MSYEFVDPTELEQFDDRDVDVRSISDAAGLTARDSELGLRVYEADPGEQLPLTYHYHETQVEAFYVLSGTLSVETPEEEFTVGADQAFVVHPENPHRAYNLETAVESVRVLAIGAPSVDDGHAYDPDDTS